MNQFVVKDRAKPVDSALRELYLLVADVATFQDCHLEIKDTERDGLVAYLKVNGKTVNKIKLSVQVINEETKLPLESKLEYDERLDVLQQKYPSKHWNKERKPRSKSHVYGLAPKTRKGKRYPFSGETLGFKDTSRRRPSSKSKKKKKDNTPVNITVPWAVSKD